MTEYLDDSLRLRLMEASRSGSSTYIQEYSESFDQISAIHSASKNSSTRPLIAANAVDAINAVKVTLLYNEVSTLSIGSTNQAQITILNPERYGGVDGFTVTVPSDRKDIARAAESGQSIAGSCFRHPELMINSLAISLLLLDKVA